MSAELSSLTEQQQSLVRRALPLVERCARDIARRGGRRVKESEIFGPGALALCEAARTYREDKHPSFEYYAELHVRGRMLDAIRAEHWTLGERVELAMERAGLAQAKHEMLTIDLLRDETDTLKEEMRRRFDDRLAAAAASAVFEARRPTAEEDLAARQDYERAIKACEHALQQLTPAERDLVLLVHRDGRGLDEASQELGIHYNTAQRRIARALRALAAAMIARGIRHAPRSVDVEHDEAPRPPSAGAGHHRLS